MFDQIFDAIEEWMRGLLTGIIHSNLDRMFTDVNGMWYKQELQDVNSLKLGANYRLNDIVGFFVELDNLLNKRWDTHYGMGTQPLGVMGGVSLLF